LNSLYLNFYGERVYIESEWHEIVILLRKDFSCFVTPEFKTKEKFLFVKIDKKNPTSVQVPKIVSRMQSLNSITYQVKGIRYNDYYGKLLSVFDYALERAEIYSESEDKAHEVVYLLILSRIGKRLDRKGFHKLHAFAISYESKAFVCMMPMKGGKSTLLMELLKNEKVKMISDDIPLIDQSGAVLSFPIKIGTENIDDKCINIDNPEENIYFLDREQYGRKAFICLDGVKSKIEVPGSRFTEVILAEGFRYHFEGSELVESSWLKSFKGLFKHGVIGIGLPMILEYFWEFGLFDFYTKTMIFFQRLKAFLVLSLKSRRVTLKLGKNSELAAAEIIRFLQARQ
jgi:hypothetical protein